ncbi:MAG: hypothetical protein PVH04_06520 [Gammaproteobacteria bacterium]|jgi:hypothetical protein
MTPVYRSPDQDQARAIRSLLQDHNIQASIIETRKTTKPFGASPVTWYELWLRHYADAGRAKSIITQHEFTTFKTSMSSYRSTVVKNSGVAHEGSSVAAAAVIDQPTPVSEPQPVDELVINDQELMSKLEQQAAEELQQEPQPLATQARPGAALAQRREDLIPINNKRVFKRLGLLLGFSEEEIEKLDSNKLYRPWDGESLMEKIKNLKQKCS